MSKIMDKILNGSKGVQNKVEIIEQKTDFLKLSISNPFEGKFELELRRIEDPAIYKDFCNCLVEQKTDKTFEVQLDTGDEVIPVKMTYNHFKNWLFRTGTKQMLEKYLPTTDSDPDPEEFFTEYLSDISIVGKEKMMLKDICVVNL